MSNNRNRKNILSKQQQRKKKQMLVKMSKEIKKLEYDLKHVKSKNLKISTIRNLKISLKAVQRVAPYVLTAGIVFGGFSVLGGTPFFIDKRKNELDIMKEFDSLGNIRTVVQYEDYEQTDNKLFYYGKWEKIEDGFCKRIIETYELKNKTEQEIINMLEIDDISLESVFGKPISKKIETKNNVTEEELYSKPYLQAIIYNKDKNDYIIIKESVGENIGLTCLYLVITILCQGIPFLIRLNSNFDFEDSVKLLKNKYQKVDVDKLKKVLELKKQNYERLMK